LKEKIERTKREGRENVGFEVHDSTMVVIKY
jgi:hypothetical protein